MPDLSAVNLSNLEQAVHPRLPDSPLAEDHLSHLPAEGSGLPCGLNILRDDVLTRTEAQEDQEKKGCQWGQ
ncbi:hypothetical protein RS9916_26164 [Synechococcus sp. RS9916]|nr:hypothetical protein RS9916_26164 [Synechococcus sp. RS9916]